MNKNFDKYLRSLGIPFNLSKSQAWENIYKKTIAESVNTRIIPLSSPFFKRKSFWVGAAASLALLFSVGYLLNLSAPVEHIARTGEIQTIELPDGSTAVLNANSNLSFDPNNWFETRVVELSGEAFFNVNKGSAFLVTTENGVVEVLGTSFNVYSRNNEFNVSCKTGKVKVSDYDKSFILSPGLCTFSKKGVLVNPHPYESDLIGIWQEQQFYHFENVSLEYVFDELERQFSVSFELNDVPGDIVVNADINIQELEKALNVVCATYGLNADQHNKSVYKISKN